jgi:hypothetical protein
MWRYLRKMADPDLRQGLFIRGSNVSSQHGSPFVILCGQGESLFVIQTGASKPTWGKSWRGSLKQVLFSVFLWLIDPTVRCPRTVSFARSLIKNVSWRSATEARSNLTARYSIPGHLVGHLGFSINLAEARVKDLGALRMPPGIPIQCVLGVVDFSVITDLVDVDLFDPFDDQELNKLSPLSLPVQLGTP